MRRVRILHDDWSVFGTIATVVDECPREGSSMIWVELDDGTLAAISKHECEEIEDDAA